MWQLQGPEEKRTWEFNWTEWLTAGDGVVSSEWSISPEGPTLEDDTVATGEIASVVVSGLELGTSYSLRNQITTDDGSILIQAIILRCQRS